MKGDEAMPRTKTAPKREPRKPHPRLKKALHVLLMTLLAVILYTPVSLYLKLAPLTGAQLFTAIGLAAASVLWYEFVKLVTKLRKR